MKRIRMVGTGVATLVGLMLLDVGFHSFGGTYQETMYSPTLHLRCAIFGGDRVYQRIGDRAWMTDAVGGYWCMDKADLEAFDRSRG